MLNNNKLYIFIVACMSIFSLLFSEPSNALRLKIVSECPEPNWILAEISNFNAIVSYYPLDSTKIRLFFRYTRYVTNPLQQMNSTTYRDTLIDIRTSLVNGKWVGRIGPFPNDTTIFASVSIADVNGEYSRIAIDTNTFFIRTLRLGICDREAINFSSVRIDAKIPDDIQHKDGLYLSYKLSNLNSILNPDRRTMIVKVMWDTSDAYVLDPNLQIPGQQILNPADLLYDSTEYRIVSKGVFPGQKYHVTAFAMDTLGHWSTATRIKDTVTTPVPIPIADSVELKILADTAFSISYEKLRRYVPGTPNIELIKNAVFIISDSGPISPSLLVDPIERHYYLNGSNNVSSRTGRTFLIITRDIFLTSSYVVGVNEQILLDKNYWVYVAYLSGYEVSLPVLVDRLEYRPSKPYFKQTSAIQLNDSTLRISFRTYDTADVNLGVQIKYSINGNSPNSIFYSFIPAQHFRESSFSPATGGQMILVRDSLYTIDIRLQARFECAGKPTAPYLASSDTNMIAIKFLISDLMGPIPANSADDSVTLFVDIDTKERISAEQFPDDIDYEFTLGQNSPNPFNPTTEIKFSIPENGVAKMELFTLDGRRVKILQNGWLKKGRYNIALRTDDLMSGTYLYRLSTGKQVSSKVMSIIK